MMGENASAATDYLSITDKAVYILRTVHNLVAMRLLAAHIASSCQDCIVSAQLRMPLYT